MIILNTSSKTMRAGHTKNRGRTPQYLCVVFLLAIVLSLVFFPINTYGQQQGPFSDGLFFLQSGSTGHSQITHKSHPFDNTSNKVSELSIPVGCMALGMYASPHGPWLAIEVTCEANTYVQVINSTTGNTINLGSKITYEGYFLNWAPTGNKIIVRSGDIPNSIIHIIQINSGNVEILPVPGTVYDLAISTNGSRMIYSLTRGLGYGSETWIADIDGGNAQQVLLEPNHIIAFAHWSPAGDEITYIRMPDSNIPFTIGELWIMNGNGENSMLLGNADAGHGYRPAWSPDGQQIAYVAREMYDNGTDIGSEDASYVADQLVSNIYVANVNNREIDQLTHFESSLTESPVWSPNGEYIAFSTTAGGNGPDVWVVEMVNGNLHQVTFGAFARNPTWLSNP